MDLEKSSLGFMLPVLHENTQDTVIKKSTISNWRSNLSMENLGEACKEIYVILNKILVSKIPCEELLEIADLMRPTLQWAYQIIRKNYINYEKGLSEKDLVVFGLGQKILIATVIIYKKIVNSVAEFFILNKQHKKNLTIAIYRALYYSKLVLVSANEMHMATPPLLWREIYILFAFASKKSLFADYDFDYGKCAIKSIFNEILIIGLLDMYGFTKIEQQNISLRLHEWSAKVSIKKTKRQDLGVSGYFFIDINSDDRPLFLRNDMQKNLASIYTIDAKELGSFFKQMKDSYCSQSHNMGDVSLNTLSNLEGYFVRTIDRQETRESVSREAKIVFGMTEAHYFLNDAKEFLPHKTNKGYEAKVSLSAVGEHVSHNNAEVFEHETSEINNCSTRGMCVTKTGVGSKNIDPGKIVALKIAKDIGGDDWFLGIVRWVRIVDVFNVSYGIETLRSKTKPAILQQVRKDEVATKFQNCFVVFQLNKSQELTLLVTPSVPFKTDATVRVILDENDLERFWIVKLSKQIYATNSFKVFEVQSLQDYFGGDKCSGDKISEFNDDNIKDIIDKDKHKDNDLDSIWGSFT